MFENTTHTEACNTVTYVTVDYSYGMTVGLPDRRNSMAGVAGNTRSHDGRAGMVREGVFETCRRMAGHAFDTCVRVRWAWRFSDGCVTVVAVDAAARNTGMIKATVHVQCKKTGGIVAAVTLDIRR